jgi:ketosteroid isomerase-like protein
MRAVQGSKRKFQIRTLRKEKRPMKRFFTIGTVVVLTLAASGLMLGQERNAEKEVRTVLKQVVDAAVKGDVAALDKVLADDFRRIQSDGSELTKTQILEGFKSGNMKFDAFDESDIETRLYGNVAVVISTANIKMRSVDGKVFSGQFRNSRVFVKRDGNWRVVLFHSSKIG